MLTANTVKPEPRYFSYRRARCGISTRQGPHHVAQKLIITTCPRCSCSRKFGPSRLGSVKSGAPADGVTAASAAPIASANTGAAMKRSAENNRIRLIGCTLEEKGGTGRELK